MTHGQATVILWSILEGWVIYMKSGRALVELRWPNGRTDTLYIAHDQVGTSQFHPLHGQVRQARFNHSGISADLYISGHRHTWDLMSMEMRGRVVWMCRARGFKDHGEYEVVKGFEAEKLGHTITAILPIRRQAF